MWPSVAFAVHQLSSFGRLILGQVFVEPSYAALNYVAGMSRIREVVALVRINYQFCRDLESLERVPKFKGLRRRAFAITVADDDQGRRFHVLDEGKRRAFFVDLWIVVDADTEERNHRLVHFVLAVIALQVGNTCTGHGGAEALGLGHAPHGHVAAIAPTR